MSISIRPGARLYSAVCATELIVVKSPIGEAEITIGGVPPLSTGADGKRDAAIVDGFGAGTAMGKRYVDAEGTIELLCTKAGDGVPALAGAVLSIKDAKPLELPPDSGVCVDSMTLAYCSRIRSRLVPVSGNRGLNDDVVYYTILRSRRTLQVLIDQQISKNIGRSIHA